MKEIIKEIVEREYGSIAKKDAGVLVYEMYADYRDEMSDETAAKILRSVNPEQELEEVLDSWYWEQRNDYLDDLVRKVSENLSKALSPEAYFALDEDYLREIVEDYIWFDVPRDHYLDQEFYVDIMLDTGDGNYDYALNSVYPCWYGSQEEYHNDKAAIVWLAKQQGYGKRVFRNAMNQGDISTPHGFLESVRQELANLPSHMSTVTFLVKMTLRELMELNRLIRLQDRNGRFYDATKNPYCGYIVLDKSTETGLYSPWQGGGSVFEIQLEKDVKLPIRFIRSALPDGTTKHEYSVSEVYGMCGSAWRNTVKEIHAPVEFRKEK